MRIRNFFILILVSAIIELVVLEHFKIFHVQPDLVLIEVVFSVLILPFRWVLIISAFAGILKDFLGLGIFGINTVLFPLYCIFIRKLSQNINMDNVFILTLVIFLAVFFRALVLRVAFLYLERIIPTGVFLDKMFSESLYVAFLVPLAYKYFAPLMNI